MDRRSFGAWGVTLDSDTLACAFAAVGVLRFVDRFWDRGRFAAPNASAEELTEAVRAALTDYWSGPIEWSIGTELFPPAQLPDAARFATAWRTATAEIVLGPRTPLRLRAVEGEVQGDSGSTGPLYAVELLSRPATRVTAVFVPPEALRWGQPWVRTRATWHWPLRIGFLGDADSSRLRADIERHEWLAPLVQVGELGGGREVFDLLVVPLGLRVAVARVLERNVRASFVLLLRGPREPWPQAAALITALQAHTRCAGIGLARVPESERDSWLSAIMAMLSHDEGLDVALYEASRSHSLPTPVIFAEQRLLERTRMATVARTAAARMVAAGMERPAEIDHLAYENETTDATMVAACSADAQARLEAETGAESRRIQAQIHELGEGAPRVIRAAALRPNATHEVAVRIGPPSGEWVSTDRAFPSEALPDTDEPHTLTVVFTDLSLEREPQVGRIELPWQGPSTACRFTFVTGGDRSRFEARVIVLHRNRVLQTARLSAAVEAERSAFGEGPAARFATVETVVRDRLDGLGARGAFDAALVVNHTADGLHNVTTVADDRADIRWTPGLDERLRLVRTQLDAMVKEPEVYAEVRGEAMRRALVLAARNGSLLHGELATNQLGDELAAAERLQVLSATADGYLPVEFVYDRPSPDDDAKLCDHAEEALGRAFLDTQEHRERRCPGGCPVGRERRRVVCPLGFWSLSKIIERQPHSRRVAGQVRHDYVVQGGARGDPMPNRRRLPAPRAALFAASHLADKPVRGTVAAAIEALGRALGRPVTHARTWNEWEDAVATQQPALLVALPHTLKDTAAIRVMEIEQREHLAVDRIDRAHVGGSPEGPPIVLLLGCDTADPELPYAELPSAFRQGGAAIVLGTLTRVLGRHAVRVAQRLIEALTERARGPESTFGEVLRDLRREFLLKGIPLVLVLTAYGDAGWYFGGTGADGAAGAGGTGVPGSLASGSPVDPTP